MGLSSAFPLTQPDWEPSCRAQHGSAMFPPICPQRGQGLSTDGLVTDDKAGAELTYRHGFPTFFSSSYEIAPLTSTLFTAFPWFQVFCKLLPSFAVEHFPVLLAPTSQPSTFCSGPSAKILKPPGQTAPAAVLTPASPAGTDSLCLPWVPWALPMCTQGCQDTL